MLRYMEDHIEPDDHDAESRFLRWEWRALLYASLALFIVMFVVLAVR